MSGGGGGARCRVLIGEVRRVERMERGGGHADYRSASRPPPAAASPPKYQLHLTDGRLLPADTVILATGFAAAPLASPLLADLQQRYQLPCSAEGFPITDAQLRWHPRVMLSGAYAALTVGPAAGNIIGAHLALRRLLPLLLARPYREDYAWTALQKILPAADQ